METTKRRCRRCGKELKGRQDQRYCSDHCRAMTNNKRYGKTRKITSRINKAILRNRNLLFQLSKGGHTHIGKDQLEELGFNFGYFTGQLVNHRQQTIILCYDQGYVVDRTHGIEIIGCVSSIEHPSPRLSLHRKPQQHPPFLPEQ